MPKQSEATMLKRGAACLSCRRRKLKCDSERPVCKPCRTMRRPQECRYDDNTPKSKTQTLREKLMALQAKVDELELANAVFGSPQSGMQEVDVLNDALPNNFLSFLQPIPSTSYVQGEYGHVSTISTTGGSSQDSVLCPSGPSTSAFALPMNTFGSTDMLETSGWTGSQSGGSSASTPNSHSRSIGSPFTDTSDDSPRVSSIWGVESSQGSSLSFDTRVLLIQAFIRHRKQCCFYSDITRFDSSSSATCQRPPPSAALMSTVVLLGSFFSRSCINMPPSLETELLEQALYDISRTLHRQEALLDVAQALCLLAQYFFFENRMMEGNRHLLAAKRLVADLGLHQMIHPDLSLFPPFQAWDAPSISSTLLQEEWEEKVAVFWQVFTTDKFSSAFNEGSAAITGTLVSSDSSACFSSSKEEFNSGYQLKLVTTPFPTVNPDPGNPTSTLSPSSNSAIYSLFDDDQFHAVGLAPLALKAVAAAIFDRALRLRNVNAATAVDASTWKQYHSVERAIQRISGLVPPLEAPGSALLGDACGRRCGVGVEADMDLYVVHTLLLASTIQLHHHGPINIKFSWACERMIGLAEQLREQDINYLDPILSVCWSSVMQILAHTTVHPSIMSTPASMQTTEFLGRSLKSLRKVLREFGSVVPLVASFSTASSVVVGSGSILDLGQFKLVG